MQSSTRIKNVLSSAFSVQTGLDDEVTFSLYRRAIEADPALRSEVVRAFNDKSVRWTERLFNDDYEVFEADSADEALELARRLLIPGLPIELQLCCGCGRPRAYQ